MKSKKEVLLDLAYIIQLNDLQQQKIQKLKLHEILNSKTIIKKLELSKKQKTLYEKFIKVHKNLEMLFSIEEKKSIHSTKDVLNILSPYMSSLKIEEMVAIYLNDRREVLDIKVIGKGSEKQVSSSPASVFKESLNIGASGVILAHNHPGGSKEFSDDDLRLTELVETLGNYLNVILVDHLIYTDNEVISYAEETIIEDINN